MLNESAFSPRSGPFSHPTLRDTRPDSVFSALIFVSISVITGASLIGLVPIFCLSSCTSSDLADAVIHIPCHVYDTLEYSLFVRGTN